MITFKTTINKNLSIPLHYQLREIILNEIRTGNLKEGDMLPTELELSDIFKVSRITVRQAVMDMAKEGYLYRIKGNGTFVAKPRLNLKFLYKDLSFNEQIKQQGMEPSTRVLISNIVEADEGLSSNLKIGLNEKAIQLIRLRCANNEPIAIVESYMPYDLCFFVPEHDLEKESLHEILALNPLSKICRVTREVEAISAGKYESTFLNIRQGFPLQSFLNIAYNAENRPVDYCLSRYRGDRSRFSVEIFI